MSAAAYLVIIRLLTEPMVIQAAQPLPWALCLAEMDRLTAELEQLRPEAQYTAKCVRVDEETSV